MKDNGIVQFSFFEVTVKLLLQTVGQILQYVLGMVKKTLERPDGSRMEEEWYYICSIDEDVKVFEHAVRGH